MRLLLILLFILSSGNYLHAQRSSLSKPPTGDWQGAFLGSSVTYIWNPNPDQIGNSFMQEITWSFNASLPIHRQFVIGVDNKLIMLQSTLTPWTLHHLTGPFTQFNFTPTRKSRLFIQANLMLGNYCTCGEDDPYKEDFLFYWGFGAGWNFYLSRNLYLDLAFENYNIFQKIEGKYNYTQYIIGLDYHFSRKKE